MSGLTKVKVMIEEAQGIDKDTPASLSNVNLPVDNAPFTMTAAGAGAYDEPEANTWTMENFWFVEDFDIGMGQNF